MTINSENVATLIPLESISKLRGQATLFSRTWRISAACVIAIALVAVGLGSAQASHSTPGYLHIEKVKLKVQHEDGTWTLDVKIHVDDKIPLDGSGGAFGYAILTAGFDNVLVLVTHIGIEDSQHVGRGGFHTHVLDLKAATENCGGFDAEVDLVGSAANSAFDPGYRFKVAGRNAEIRDVPTSDLGDAGVEAFASFTVTPVFSGDALTNLCVHVVEIV